MNQPEMTGWTVGISVFSGVVTPLVALVLVVVVDSQAATAAFRILAEVIVPLLDLAEAFLGSGLTS